MTVATQGANRAPRPSSLADVLEIILDKGIVIDAYVRVSLVGIELLTIDARIVIASVDTYLRFAEAVNRLDLQPEGQVSGLPGLMREVTEGGSKQKTKGALDGAKEKASDFMDSLTGDDDEDDDERDDERDDEQEAESSGSSGSRTRKRAAPKSRRAPARKDS